MSTAAVPVPTSPEPRTPASAATGSEFRSARAAAAIAAGTLVFLAVDGIALSVNWRVGIPVVLAASIAGVLLVNSTLSHGLAVDERSDAVERMLREHEGWYPQTLTGVDAELALLVTWTRGALRSATGRTRYWVAVARTRLLHGAGSLQTVPLARAVHTALRRGGGEGYGAGRSQ